MAMPHINLNLSPIRNVDVGVESMEGFINRSFVTKSWFFVRDRYLGTKMKFILGMHFHRGVDGIFPYALLEVKYTVESLSGDFGISKYKLKSIDQETWLRFFDLFMEDFRVQEDRLCQRMKQLLTTLPDGKTPAFKCDLFDVTNFGNVLGECLVSQFLGTFRWEFPLFLLYGDRISTSMELDNILKVMTDIDDISYYVKHNIYETKRKESIDALLNLESEVSAKERELSNVFEKSADAMNMLSDQYGIEIDLDNACCPIPKIWRETVWGLSKISPNQTDPIKIPNAKISAFRTNAFLCKFGLPSLDCLVEHFCLTLYWNSKHPLESVVEIRCRRRCDSGLTTKPIDPKLIRTIFSDNPKYRDALVELAPGRSFFRGGDWVIWMKRYDERTSNSIAGQLLSRLGESLAIALSFPDKVKSIHDAQKVYGNICKIDAFVNEMGGLGEISSQIEKLKKRISQEKSQIEEYDSYISEDHATVENGKEFLRKYGIDYDFSFINEMEGH